MWWEYIKRYKSQHQHYDWRDTAHSLSFGFLGALFDLLMKGTCFFILDWVNQFAILPKTWLDYSPLLSWLIVFVAQDFAFYWLHRTEHRSRIFWAVHSNHHSSEHYNFAVALRSSVFQPFYRFLFYIPVAWLGFDGLTIMFVYAVNQFYQFWLHTEMVFKLPNLIEKVFVTPSHHRVHHASNALYLDRNMGQVLIIWDKLFGTFQSELDDEKPQYGLTTPTKELGAFKLLTLEFNKLYEDLKQAPNWKTKLRYIFAAPGWQHTGQQKTAETLRSSYLNTKNNNN